MTVKSQVLITGLRLNSFCSINTDLAASILPAYETLHELEKNCHNTVVFFGQDHLLSLVEKFYNKCIVIMSLNGIMSFACSGLGNTHPTQPFAVVLSVASS